MKETSPPHNRAEAALYGRVSTENQRSSLDAQDAKAHEYARLKDLEVPDHLRFSDEAQSGGKPLLERPGGRLMMNTLAMCPAVRHVIVTKLDRLGRNATDLDTVFTAFRERDITLHIVDLGGDSLSTTGAVGQFMFRILSAIAELERMMIRGRILDGVEHHRSKGLMTSGTAPYGWNKVGTGQVNPKTKKEIFRIEAHPGEQQWIRQMWGWRHEDHWSLHAIAKELNARGVLTKSGRGKWQSGNVDGVLQSYYTQQLMNGDAGDTAAAA